MLAAWVAGGLAVGTLLASLTWGLLHAAQQQPSSLIGSQVPDLTIRSLAGDEVSLRALRGTPLVINFWASWCVPCKQEAPVLAAAANRLAGKVQFVGIDIQDTDSAARAYEAGLDGLPASPCQQVDQGPQLLPSHAPNQALDHFDVAQADDVPPAGPLVLQLQSRHRRGF